jgi:glutathione peroxidase
MTIYDFTVKNIDGKNISMSIYKNKILLIVNVASTCSMTSQYEGFEKLYKKYKKDGLKILAFPTNEFGQQEKGSNKEIKKFCQKNYNITFDLFEKTSVNGPNANELYKYLKGEKRGFLWTESIKWNFTKFLVDKNGKIIKRYGPSSTPEVIEKDIQSLLK